MRPTDVLETFVDNSELQHATGFAPRTSIEDGLRSFVTWYRGYRGKK
jgi:UDP-glucuronate 4-epimerase